MTTKAEERQAIARTIMETLGGGGRLKAMVGAKNFACGEIDGVGPYLGFRHMRGGPKGQGINYTKITLAPSDTYTVEFGYIRSPNYIVRSTHSDIYCDMLQELWESETGLKLSLGTMGR